VPAQQGQAVSGTGVVEPTSVGGTSAPAVSTGAGTENVPAAVTPQTGVDQTQTEAIEEAPAAETTATETPVAETPVAETPVAETPAVKPTRAKPPGRTAKLTPEQLAVNKAQRQTSAGVSRDMGRTAEKLKKDIQAPFDVGNYDTEEQAKDAFEEYNAQRIETLATAYGIANNPAHRNNKAGKTAKTVLDDPSVTAQERSIAQKRADYLKNGAPKPSKASRLGTSTDNVTNNKYLGFTSATQALQWLARNGNPFERFLANRLAPFLKGVKLVVVDQNTVFPNEEAETYFREGDGSYGMFYDGVIYLDSIDGINNTIFLHEALHGAADARIEAYYYALANNQPIDKSLAEAVAQLEQTMLNAGENFALLQKLADRGALDPEQMQNYRMLSQLAELGAFEDLKEFVAYGLTDQNMQAFLRGFATGELSGKALDQSMLSKFVTGLRKMFNMDSSHQSSMQDLIMFTDRVLAAPLAGTTAATPSFAKKAKNPKPAKIDKDLQKIQQSNSAHAVVEGIGANIDAHTTFDDVKDLLDSRFDAMGNEFIAKLLYTMQISDIIRWKGDVIPGMERADSLIRRMSSMRTTMLNASASVADEFSTFVRKYGQKEISTALHIARLKGIGPQNFSSRADALATDPILKGYIARSTDTSLTDSQRRAAKGRATTRTNDINVVFDAWDALGKQKNGHAIYNKVKQFYKNGNDLTRALLNQQIDALQIDDEAKAKLLKSAQLMYEQGAIKEYAPFSRDGDYWLRVEKGPTGRELYFFESGVARNDFLKKRAKQLKLPVSDPNFSAGDDTASLRKNMQTESLMLQQMFEVIDTAAVKPVTTFDPTKYKTLEEARAAMNDSFKETLKDQLYQTWLMTSPERSLRKQYLRAENVTGFSADALRNFKGYATRLANQTPRLAYATQATNEVSAARASLEGMPALDRAKLELFVNEIAARVEEEINPPPKGQFTTRVNQFAFIWLLTSAASAATQMASVPIMVMPTLNDEYGYIPAATKFLKYVQFWRTLGVREKQANGDVVYNAPSIGRSSMVLGNPLLRRAFQAAVDREVTTLTNTSVLTNSNRTPSNSYTNVPALTASKIYSLITGLIGTAERMSREITYMMTFELEYAKTKDFDASVAKASGTVDELLGRYDNMNRPRILKNAAGRTVGQFKMYSVFQSSWFVRNFYNSVRLTIPLKERASAMHKLTGVLLMGGMFHGLVGFPGYSTITATIDAVLKSLGDDDEDNKRRRRKDPLTAENSDLRFRYEFLPEYFGHIEVPGIDNRKHRLSDMLEKGPISILTDMNIGSRTSFDGMWFRSPTPGKDWKGTATNFIVENLGPGVSAGTSLVSGLEDLNDGKIVRGLEKLVPAFFKGSLTAYRMDTESAETRRGDDILKRSEINTLNLIAQVLGFPPARLVRQQETNFATKKEMDKATNERRELLNKVNEIVFDKEGDKRELKEAFANIVKHNRRYPIDKVVIDADTIDRSVEAYAERTGKTFRGLYIPENMIPYALPLSKAGSPLQ
jgi:hypothetical protein